MFHRTFLLVQLRSLPRNVELLSAIYRTEMGPALFSREKGKGDRSVLGLHPLLQQSSFFTRDPDSSLISPPPCLFLMGPVAFLPLHPWGKESLTLLLESENRSLFVACMSTPTWNNHRQCFQIFWPCLSKETWIIWNRHSFFIFFCISNKCDETFKANFTVKSGGFWWREEGTGLGAWIHP